MNCSRCGVALAAGSTVCPRCGMAAGASTAPLTIEQINWLRVNAFGPPIFALAIIGGVALMFSCFFGQLLDRPFVKAFAIVAGLLLLGVLAAVALHVRNTWADLRAGVAQVRVARLADKRASAGSSGGRTYYAEFEEVGSVIVMHDIYEPLVVGRLYQVTYSPHTRKGWRVDAAG
ncbi:MAG TPA: hypothetical protein VD886_11520 [Herpetosiphonaceae bacterium]|nr:hypothetical protein [Herpetosiphonaceae bacterium]